MKTIEDLKQKLAGAGIATIAIGVIFSLFFFTNIFDSCRQKKDTLIIQTVDKNILRREIADSVRAVYAKAEKISLDSLSIIKERRISALNREIFDLRAKVSKKVETYREGTIFQSAACDSVIEAYEEYTDTLNASIRSRDELLTVKDSMILYWTAQYWASENNYLSAKADISDLRKRLVPHTSWWLKNSKWIYVGAGFVGGVLLMK